MKFTICFPISGNTRVSLNEVHISSNSPHNEKLRALVTAPGHRMHRSPIEVLCILDGFLNVGSDAYLCQYVYQRCIPSSYTLQESEFHFPWCGILDVASSGVLGTADVIPPVSVVAHYSRDSSRIMR